MTIVAQLIEQREKSLSATAGGPPARTGNPFFGVGPITDMVADDVDARRLRFEFDAWLERRYPKLNDKGHVIGKFTTAELARGMHRGYPADQVLLDMMREIHRYFRFPKQNPMAVGLGGGHSGFTVCALHLVNANRSDQHLYVDTPQPESELASGGGFFRQSWGAQLIEMHRYAVGGDERRVHFSTAEGAIPSADVLERMQTKIFFGVGHETTGATTYTENEVRDLLSWLDRNPDQHHAVIDATSMLGAMPWPQALVDEVMAKCCMFMPFQKAIGGIAGYFVISLTPAAVALVNSNQKKPSWAIPRQLKIAVPCDAGQPLSSVATTDLGPLYDPEQDAMQGGIINTFSTLAFAETTFGLLRAERYVGDVTNLNRRAVENRQIVNRWVEKNPLFALGVQEADRRGAAVTLLRVVDPDITDPNTRDSIVAKSKQLLAYDGLTHVNGEYEKGLDVARYVNAFPGTPGDYRAWIGGIRPTEDITALLDNLEYAYHRAKIAVLEEQLAEHGTCFVPSGDKHARVRKDDPGRAYKVLIADLVGLKFDAHGQPDYSEVRAHVETKGGVFHNTFFDNGTFLESGKIHFFYQPQLSVESELSAHTADGKYDALIAAATNIPEDAVFALGGVRIGAGTGNMGSASWGGGDGTGGIAPLMNTPSFNSRATAQMAIKALLKVCPDLPVDALHEKVVAGQFDTGRNLCEYPTEKIEGKRVAVIGYGNIGREFAKLAQAFGAQVIIHARAKHQAWIESEGFIYAASMQAAAKAADVLSIHIGLGTYDPGRGRFANAGLIDAKIFDALSDGAIVINYDRGELIDITALDNALLHGKVRYAAIDADLFKDAATEVLSGPMQPYLELAKRYPGRLELLPHAAADTEHLSRVAGAKQAVDQIFDAIQYRVVTNLKGDLPPNYSDDGARTVSGVGRVTHADIRAAASEPEQLQHLRQSSEQMAAFWGALASCDDTDRREAMIARYGAELVESANSYNTLIEALGLRGPCYE